MLIISEDKEIEITEHEGSIKITERFQSREVFVLIPDNFRELVRESLKCDSKQQVKIDD